MSDESPDTSAAPGSTAGDAAHTTKIPQMERPAGETDKGRPRPAAKTPAKPAPAPAAKSTPAKSAPAKKSPSKAPAAKSTAAMSSGPVGRPLTASDYARTTSQSASSTAVIPAVKDDSSTSGRTTTAPSSTPPSSQVQVAEPGSGRAATLRLSHVEPWSVTRMAFAISVALMIVSVVAVTIFWLVLEVTGVWGQIDNSVTSVLSDDSSSFQITDYLGFWRLVGLSLVLSALNVVIFTVLATIAAHLYNLAAQMLGGFQVTFTSKD